MDREIKKRIEEEKTYITEYDVTLQKIEDITKALLGYDKKIINISFFKKYFSETITYSDTHTREFIKYELSSPRYEYQKKYFTYRLWIYASHELELKSRDREDILQALSEKKDQIKIWKSNEEKRLSQMEEAKDQEGLILQINNLIKISGNEIFRSELLSELKYNRE